MRKIFVCIGFLLLGFNLAAQIDKKQIVDKIAALEDSLKVKIEQFGARSSEAQEVVFNLNEVLKEHSTEDEAHKTTTEIYTKAVQIALNGRIDEEIAALEDSVKVKIGQYGASSMEARKSFSYLRSLLNEHDRKTAHEFYGKVVYEFYRKTFKANQFTPIALYNQRVATLEDGIKVKIEKFGEKSEEVVSAYFDLFNILYGHAKYDEVLTIAKKCLSICIEIFDEKHATTAIAYNNLGEVYLTTGAYDKAFENIQKALAIRLELFGEVDSLSAVSFNTIGEIYLETGKYSNAFEYFQKALAVNLEILGEKHPSTAGTYNNIGAFYAKTEHYSKALEFYNKALIINKKILGEWHPSTAGILSNIGFVYEKTRDESFNNFYNEALEINIGVLGDKHPSTATSYDNVGKISEPSRRLEYHQKALAINSKILGEKHPSTAGTLSNIGSVYYREGAYYKALGYYEKAKAIYFEVFGERHPSTAQLCYDIGLVYEKKGNYTKALEYHQKALEIRIEVFEVKRTSIAYSYYHLGKIYSQTENYSKALSFYQKALVICLEVLEKHYLTATLFNNIGSTYLENGNYNKAITNCNKALEINPNLIPPKANLAITFENLSQFKNADSLWNVVMLDIQNQSGFKVLPLSLNEKLLNLNTINHTIEKFYSYMNHYGSEDIKLIAANHIINTKAQLLAYAVHDRNNNSDGQLIVKIANKKIKEAKLLTKEEQLKRGFSLDRDIDFQIIGQVFVSMIEEPELYPELHLSKLSWQQVQEKLEPGEALIDYFSFFDRIDSAQVYHAMLIKKDEPKPVFIPLSITKPVTDLLEIKDKLPYYVQFKESRKEMYSYLWQALEPHLQNIKTIHLTPVASLNKIDFESLQNENNQYLADLFDFYYYSSSKDFYKQQQSQPNYKSATLYGHIAYYKKDEQPYEAAEDTFALRLQRDTLVRLPATLPEVKAIEKICTKNDINPALFTIHTAAEDTVKHFSGDRAPGIMHFATHGAYLPPLNKEVDSIEMVSLTVRDRFRVADNPLQRSMLMLSNAGETWQKSGPNIIADNDGILTALEVTNLDLSNTELVVLSACNSGIGSQHTTEGVFGLPRAFKLAGVDKILVSLWPVEDETTKELMIQFYTNLLQNKQDAATALRNAKAEMRKRNDAPKKWAGFVLVE